MSLTKTDFIQFLNCPQSIWLKKNIPEKYPEGKFSLFVKKLINEGYEVEEYAKMLFSNAINLPENAAIKKNSSININQESNADNKYRLGLARAQINNMFIVS